MRFQIQLIPAQTCLLNYLPLPSPGSPLTRTTESFAVRIDGSTASIHRLCLRLCVQRKVISRAACQFTVFFCWLGLLFQMPILGIRLDDMTAERIAYVWVDAHLLQAPFCGANLCFLLAFCGWSGLAEGENKAQAYLFHWLYGRWFAGWRSIPRRKGGQGSKIPPHTRPDISLHGIKSRFHLCSFSRKLQLLVSWPSSGLLILTHYWSSACFSGVELGWVEEGLDFTQSSVVILWVMESFLWVVTST